MYFGPELFCTDKPQVNILELGSWVNLLRGGASEVPFPGNDASSGMITLSVIIAEHVLQHLSPDQVEVVAASAFAVLEAGGVFRIAVPDGYKRNPAYQTYVGAGSSCTGVAGTVDHGCHLITWTVDTLPRLFEKIGFVIRLREYYDITGEFVEAVDAYADDDLLGIIERSARHDPRNKYKNRRGNALWLSPAWTFLRAGRLQSEHAEDAGRVMTSLWFDAIKPADCKEVLF